MVDGLPHFTGEASSDAFSSSESLEGSIGVHDWVLVDGEDFSWRPAGSCNRGVDGVVSLIGVVGVLLRPAGSCGGVVVSVGSWGSEIGLPVLGCTPFTPW